MVGAPYQACRLSTEAKTPSRAIWGGGQPPSRAVWPPKARSTAVPCHVGLAGTVYAPQIAPRQQGWYWGISLLPLHPSHPFRKGIPHPLWPWGARQEGVSLPCPQDAGECWQDDVQGSDSSPGSTLEGPPLLWEQF